MSIVTENVRKLANDCEASVRDRFITKKGESDVEIEINCMDLHAIDQWVHFPCLLNSVRNKSDLSIAYKSLRSL